MAKKSRKGCYWFAARQSEHVVVGAGDQRIEVIGNVAGIRYLAGMHHDRNEIGKDRVIEESLIVVAVAGGESVIVSWPKPGWNANIA